ncbi:HPr kinase/phosphorylase [Dinoroseobacter sp. S124A]|uniref:HPr kinase/phosphorylase n=1 Tax=Dinoroseobacter sp. S124A TaxID=3415128 RepID=UPI003C7D1B64
MDEEEILHATSVAIEGRALVITGPSGTGKSDLALQMIALGAGLICDDRTRIRREGDQLWANPAPNATGLIEARGLGLLPAPDAAPAPISALLDLTISETDRLPPERTRRLLGLPVVLLHKVTSPSFPAALILYLRQGRAAP